MADGCFQSHHAEIRFHDPRFGSVAFGEFAPKFFSELLCIWQNHPQDLAAADESVVPTEVVIENEFKRLRLAGFQCRQGHPLRLGFQAAAAERAFDFAVGIKQRLGPEFLRAGTFHAGDDAERDGFAIAGGGGKRLEDGIGHGRIVTRREKAPSTNIQAPENNQAPNFKPTRMALELLWSLVLGCWSFDFPL